MHATCDWTATQLYDPVNKGAYPTCHAWGANVLNDLLSRLHPDVVITTSLADMTTMAHPVSTCASLGPNVAVNASMTLSVSKGV